MREYSKKPESQSRTLDSNPKASRQAPIDVILQRYKERNIQRYVEDEELIQGKFSDTAQREVFDEDELLHGKFDASSSVQREEATQPPTKNLTGMPDSLKSGIESLSGYNMDDVHVHYNSSKPAQLHALAYTQGTDIHVAPGQEQYLAHEAWHVVQQKQGRVKPTIQMHGININDNEWLEDEADVMGLSAQKYAVLISDNSKQIKENVIASDNEIVQRSPDEKSKELIDEKTDINVEIEDFITKLQSLSLIIDISEEKELQNEIDNCIAKLHEIREDKNDIAKSEFIQVLKEKMDTIDIGQMNSDENCDSEMDKETIVQGVFEKIFSWIRNNPKIIIVTEVLVVTSVALHLYNEKKKKVLPPKLGLMNFTDYQKYYNMLLHHINRFCTQEGCNPNQQKLIAEKAWETMKNNLNYGEDTFLEDLKKNVAALDLPPRLKEEAYIKEHFIDPFKAGINVIINKKKSIPKVESKEQTRFSEALKELPFVKKLYDKSVYANMDKKYRELPKNVAASEWQDKGCLQDKIKREDDGNRLTKDDREVKNGNFKQKVRQTDIFFKQALHPLVIKQIKKPTICVHLRNKQSFTCPWGLRAYYSPSSQEVHVAQNTQRETIAHETGHHIEHLLPVQNFADIRKLLEARNIDNPKASYIYPLSWEEQRFHGDYPATGKYTSKYYDDGASEVMSMSMEYLSNPSNMKKLIENDPQQAAIILRILNPTDYKKNENLRDFDKYLP